MTIDQRLRLLLESKGAKSVIKDINLITATSENAAKARDRMEKKYGFKEGTGKKQINKLKNLAEVQRDVDEKKLDNKKKLAALEVKKLEKAKWHRKEEKRALSDKWKMENDAFAQTEQKTKERARIKKFLDIEGVDPSKIKGKSLKQLRDYEHQIKKVNRRIRKSFKMHWLGIMFGGMALQRVMKPLIQGMLKDYKELTKGGLTPLSKSLTALEANWKFLKYSIVEAASPLLVNLADAFANYARTLAESDPETLKDYAIGIGLVYTAATVAMAGGQIALFFGSLKGLTANVTLQTLTTMQTKISTLRSAAGGLISIGFAIEDAADVSKKIDAEEYASAIGTTLGAAAGLSYAFRKGARGGNRLILVGIGMELLGGITGKKQTIDTTLKSIGELLGQAGLIKMIMGKGGVYMLAFSIVLSIDGIRLGLGDVAKNWWKGILTGFKFLGGDETAAQTVFKQVIGDKLVYDEQGQIVGASFSKGFLEKSEKKLAVELPASMEEGLRNATDNYLTDEEKGFAAMEAAAKAFNATLSETINKTVNITHNYSSNYDDVNQDSTISGG